MGRLINGINGAIVGKVGTVIGSSRNGKPYIKGPYKKRTRKVSKKELANRHKFAAAQAWLKPLLNFVREGFHMYKMTSGAFMAAKSYLLRHAFEGEQQAMRINPVLVKLSVGELPLPGDIAVAQTAPGELQFTWDTAGVQWNNKYDQVMMLAYNVENAKAHFNKAYYKLTGQFRSAGADILRIDPAPGKTWHLYLAFTSADRSSQSDSVYLGTISN